MGQNCGWWEKRISLSVNDSYAWKDTQIQRYSVLHRHSFCVWQLSTLKGVYKAKTEDQRPKTENPRFS